MIERTRVQLAVRLVLALFCFAAISPSSANADESQRSLSELHAEVAKLASAVDISKASPQTLLSRRRAFIAAWERVIRRIETSYDPSYNPRDPAQVPFRCVPPPTTRDPESFTCNDPDAIKDPAAKASYETLLRENERKLQRAAYYHDLHNIDDLAMTSLEADLRLFREAGAPPDTAALTALLEQAGLNTVRQRAIRAML